MGLNLEPFMWQTLILLSEPHSLVLIFNLEEKLWKKGIIFSFLQHWQDASDNKCVQVFSIKKILVSYYFSSALKIQSSVKNPDSLLLILLTLKSTQFLHFHLICSNNHLWFPKFNRHLFLLINIWPLVFLWNNTCAWLVSWV